MSKEVKALIRERNKLRKKITREGGSVEEKADYKATYNDLRKKVESLFVKERSERIQEKRNQIKGGNGIKEWWSFFNVEMGRKQKCRAEPPCSADKIN